MNIDDVAAAMTDVWQDLTSSIAGADLFREEGAVGVITGVPAPTLNGVLLRRASASAAAVTALLDKVAASGLPHCLWLRSDSDEALYELAAKRGMNSGQQVPAMVLDGRAAAAQPSPAGLTIRRLSPAQAPVHHEVAAAGFGIPVEVFQRLCNPAVLALDSVRCYVGELDGQPVTTGISCTLGGRTGIFDIATVPPFRGRGFASAITARIAADGLAAGSSWCWLQASDEGYQVYRNIGFRDVDTWACWVSE